MRCGEGTVESAYRPLRCQDGVTQPLTGAFAASGNYVTQGAKIAEDQINAGGGVADRKIQLVVDESIGNTNHLFRHARPYCRAGKR